MGYRHKTLVEIFEKAEAHYAERPVYGYPKGDGWEQVTYEQFARSAWALAAMWPQFGCNKGDKLAIFSETRYEWMLSDWSAQLCGLVTIPIYPSYGVESLRYIMEHSEAKIICVSSAENLGKVAEFRRQSQWDGKVVVFDKVEGYGDWADQLDDLIEQGARLPKPGHPGTTENDLATIIYTSGTTGMPKGVMLTHKNLTYQADVLIDLLKIVEDDLYLSYLPLAHVYERTVNYAIISGGAPIFYAKSIDDLAPTLREIKPSILMAVPRVIEKVHGRIVEGATSGSPIKRALFNWAINKAKVFADTNQKPALYGLADTLVFKKIRAALGGRMRLLISGSAALSKELANFFYGIGVPIYEGYGQTETSPVIAVNSPERIRPGSVGPPIPGVEVTLADDGEILVKGDVCTQGYYKEPEKTKELFDEAGWLKTGDIGRIDNDGFVFITDRKKELIKTSQGKYVAPAKVEGMLKLHAGVLDVALLGESRPYCVAVIFPDFDLLRARYQHGSEEDLVRMGEEDRLFEKAVDETNRHLDRHETVKAYRVIPVHLQMGSEEYTPSLKLKRRVIAEKYGTEIETLYQEASQGYEKVKTA